MNMAIRSLPRRSATKMGIAVNFGKEPNDSFTQDQNLGRPAVFLLICAPLDKSDWHRKNDYMRWHQNRARRTEDYSQSLEIANN